MMSHENVLNRYTTTFVLIHHYNYSLSEIENMIPWERDVYIGMYLQDVEDRKNNTG
jgi:hypothetical protein